MNTLTLWQPWTSALVLGLKGPETRSWPAPPAMVGERFAIHSAKRTVTAAEQHLLALLPSEPHVVGKQVRPLGCIVGSGRLVACVPIIDDCGTDMEAPAHVCLSGDVLLHHRPASDPFDNGDTECSLTRYLPWGDYSPGRFAWLFDDLAPTTERCPWCWACVMCGVLGPQYRVSIDDLPALSPDYEGTVEIADGHYHTACGHPVAPCPACEGAGKCEPIPAKGAQRVWQWTP